MGLIIFVASAMIDPTFEVAHARSYTVDVCNTCRHGQLSQCSTAVAEYSAAIVDDRIPTMHSLFGVKAIVKVSD